MTALRGSVAIVLLGTGLLGGCAALHTGNTGHVLRLQTSAGHGAAGPSLPGDVWPGAAPESPTQAGGGAPPAAETQPLRPKYETGASSSSGEYRISGTGAVKRLRSAGKQTKHTPMPAPTYSIESPR